jgi:hypothetical protein
VRITRHPYLANSSGKTPFDFLFGSSIWWNTCFCCYSTIVFVYVIGYLIISLLLFAQIFWKPEIEESFHFSWQNYSLILSYHVIILAWRKCSAKRVHWVVWTK